MKSIPRFQNALAQLGINFRLVALLVASLCCTGQILAEESADTKPTSGPAVAASGRYKLLTEQAKSQLTVELKAALKASMQAGKLEEANRITKIIESGGANADETLESMQARSAQARFKTTTQRATQEYILALKGALAQSLRAAQLNESNRITAEIKKLEDANSRQADVSSGYINLIPRIDPEKDTVAGKWTVEKGALMSSGNGDERIEIPYEPPEEYDFRITFTKTGTNCVIQMLSEAGASFIWVMGASGGFTFHYVKGAGTGPNKTTVQMPPGIKDKHRYTSLVRVRKSGVEALLDGKVVTKWVTDYSDVVPAQFWALRNRHLLGVGTGASKTLFHTIEVKEVSGSGKFQR